MADPCAHVGRGHRIPMPVVRSIIARVSWGETVVTAAAAYGYSDRTVYRLAARNPLVRRALTAALVCRRQVSIEEPVAEAADVVDIADADRCAPGCCCDVCEAERLLTTRRAARAGQS